MTGLAVVVAGCSQLNSPRLTPLGAPAGASPSRYFAESVSVVIPSAAQHPQCPNGRAVFAYGAGVPRTMSVDLAPLLLNVAEPVDPADIDVAIPNPPGTVGVGGDVVNLQCIPGGFCIGGCAGNWTSSVPTYARQTDMVMTRVPSGDILYVGLGTRRASPSFTTCSVDQPQECNCDSPVNAGGVLLLNRSSDCGRTWPTILQPIDITTIAGGTYAGLVNGFNPFFDRQEIYYDPFNSATYISVGAVGTDADGVLHDDILLFRSTDEGSTWSEPTVVSERWEPAPITSNASGQLYVFNCVGNVPTLHWSFDQGVTFQSHPIYYEENGQQIPCEFLNSASRDRLLSDIRNLLPGSTISRGPSTEFVDVIRVAYSSVDRNVEFLPGVFADRQVMRVVQVFVPLASPPSVPPVVQSLLTIRAQADAAHIVQPAFVDTTRFDGFPPADFDHRLDEAATLYWFEIPDAVLAPFVPLFAGITTRWAGFAGAFLAVPPSPLARRTAFRIAGRQSWRLPPRRDGSWATTLPARSCSSTVHRSRVLRSSSRTGRSRTSRPRSARTCTSTTTSRRCRCRHFSHAPPDPRLRRARRRLRRAHVERRGGSRSRCRRATRRRRGSRPERRGDASETAEPRRPARQALHVRGGADRVRAVPEGHQQLRHRTGLLPARKRLLCVRMLRRLRGPPRSLVRRGSDVRACEQVPRAGCAATHRAPRCIPFGLGYHAARRRRLVGGSMTRWITAALVLLVSAPTACDGESESDRDAGNSGAGAGKDSGGGGSAGTAGTPGFVYEYCSYAGPSSNADYPYKYICDDPPQFPECASGSYAQPCDCWTVSCSLPPPG